MPLRFSGERVARLLRLDSIARLKAFPMAVTAPWRRAGAPSRGPVPGEDPHRARRPHR